MDLRQDNLSTRGERSTGGVSSGRHLAGIPTRVPTGSLRLQVDGHVQRSLALSLDDLRRFEPVSVIAIAQRSGKSRSLFESRVPGGQ
jgi:DMSO/TMAO reductase YedYZ molybdopterin-dependent catalytic subunit